MKMKEDLWKSLHSEDESIIEDAELASGSDDVFMGSGG